MRRGLNSMCPLGTLLHNILCKKFLIRPLLAKYKNGKRQIVIYQKLHIFFVGTTGQGSRDGSSLVDHWVISGRKGREFKRLAFGYSAAFRKIGRALRKRVSRHMRTMEDPEYLYSLIRAFAVRCQNNLILKNASLESKGPEENLRMRRVMCPHLAHARSHFPKHGPKNIYIICSPICTLDKNCSSSLISLWYVCNI